MRTSSAKAKGRRLAARIADLILAAFPTLSHDDVRVTPSGVSGPDLWLSQAAKGLFGYSVECKNQEAINIWASLEQAEAHGPNPVLFFSRNRSKTFAVIEADKFIELVKQAHHL